MDIACELVERIRERPIIYLGERKLERLQAFLNGYVMREQEINPDCHNDFLRGFQEYVSAYYRVETTQGWCRIIQFFSASEEEAFQTFFQRYDEFVGLQEQRKE